MVKLSYIPVLYMLHFLLTYGKGYCSWGSRGKNIKVVCHSLLQNTSQLWCWRRLLRVPWKARRPNQCILKEINPEYSLEGLMLKLKLQYFGHLIETWVRALGQEDPWRREWLPTPVFLPEASHGQKSLAGYSPWGRRVGHE